MSSSGSRRRNLLLIVAALIVLVVAVVIGVRVASVLLTLVAPPGPPVPSGNSLVSHENIAHGSDRWVYQIAIPPCDVVAFFQAEGGDCTLRPGWCEADTTFGLGPGRTMAECSGTLWFSSFGLRWDAEVRSRTGDMDTAEIRIAREVLWSASTP